MGEHKMIEENTIEELRKRHDKETAQFVKDCYHTDVAVEDSTWGGERTITIRCKRCKLNLLSYITNKSQSFLSYVRDCANGHPDSIKYGCTATNKKDIFVEMDKQKEKNNFTKKSLGKNK